MRWRHRGSLLCIAALIPLPCLSGDTLPSIAPKHAYVEIAKTGELRGVQVAGDLDVTKLKAPASVKRIVLRDVHIVGRLHASGEGPGAALLIEMSRVRDIDFRGSRWSAALALENTSVESSSRFDDAQFDAAFALHGSKFTGPTQFPRVRFAGPVEITASHFQPAPPLRAAVTFTDARFDRSEFNSVRFDTARFEADASFIAMKVAEAASWRNVVFGADAEFRFCRLGDADFGNAEQMSVFAQLADFRGCQMHSLKLDYVDARGDLLLVNVHIDPGDLSLQQASLRGARNDFSGLSVAGKLDLQGAQVANMHMQWHQIRLALLRSAPDSSVLRPIQKRLEDLKQDNDALRASAVLADRLIAEDLARAEASFGDRALLWTERLVWGGATGYGTRLDRILAVALGCWLLLSLPLAFAFERQPRGSHSDGNEAGSEARSQRTRTSRWCSYAYAFTFMFNPDLRLRPPAQLSRACHAYLWFVRGIGLLLLALAALTLAKVSPVVQAIIGQIGR